MGGHRQIKAGDVVQTGDVSVRWCSPGGRGGSQSVARSAALPPRGAHGRSGLVRVVGGGQVALHAAAAAHLRERAGLLAPHTARHVHRSAIDQHRL